MASVGAGSAYATDIVAVQRVYYNQTYSFGYQWMVVMSTQLIGFSIGGIARRFLVSPPSMIWPANLVLCALFNTLHSQNYQGVGSRGGLSRERFFTCMSTCPLGHQLTVANISSRCVPWWLHLVLLPRLPFRRPVVLQLGLLDCAEQRPRQPDVRLLPWHGHVSHHVRLGADCVHRLSARDALVGRRQRCDRLRGTCLRLQ
jgi:hypothetical protein